MLRSFAQRKKDVLSKIDKSSRGKWDEKIKGLCEKINSFDNYYTTSSCSGRTVLMLESEKKQEGLFLKVYHEKISFEELKRELNEIASQSFFPPPSKLSSLRSEIDKKLLMKESDDKEQFNSDLLLANLKLSRRSRDNSLIIFKQEPCILHVACADLEIAEELLNKGREAGWKRSGILSLGKNIVVELNSTEKLEFPVISEGKILVSDEFLRLGVKKANENLEKSWKKIERLREKV